MWKTTRNSGRDSVLCVKAELDPSYWSPEALPTDEEQSAHSYKDVLQLSVCLTICTFPNFHFSYTSYTLKRNTCPPSNDVLFQEKICMTSQREPSSVISHSLNCDYSAIFLNFSQTNYTSTCAARSGDAGNEVSLPI